LGGGWHGWASVCRVGGVDEEAGFTAGGPSREILQRVVINAGWRAGSAGTRVAVVVRIARDGRRRRQLARRRVARSVVQILLDRGPATAPCGSLHRNSRREDL